MRVREAVGWGLAVAVLVGVAWRVHRAERGSAAPAALDAQPGWRAALDEAAGVEPAPGPTTVDVERLMGHVRRLVEWDRSTPEGRVAARAHLGHALTDLGYRPELHAFGGGLNVIGTRPGRDAGAGVVLVGAHFDAVPGSPGADDNATGLAAALEVARTFAARPTRRGLRVVFFDREEDGLKGSRRYAASEERLHDLRAVVILEMLGARCTAPGCQRHPPGLPPGLAPDRGDFLAVVADLRAPAPLAAFRRAAGPGRPPVLTLPVPDRGHALPDTRRSDHAPFWDRDVPAVLVTDTAELRSPHYHQPTDTPAHLDVDFFVGSTAVVIDAVGALLEGDE
ncbi:MAG: M20/M25/M40 family metallo-hydrolase [Myxococcales bacterium]|nr:M20/M25/M40 family metallo-hydrolase [Myxococcales bacterium]